MKDQVMPGTTLLLDGTSIFCRSAESLSAKGYNPNQSQNPQARILYVFKKDTHKPVFYQVVQGSIVYKSAFMDTVQAAERSRLLWQLRISSTYMQIITHLYHTQQDLT